MVKKAVVLAAGFGKRLRPFTAVTPKPLLPVWGEPMLSRIVSLLREQGVTEITVNCHYLHSQVERWCEENGCRVSYEPEILGTGGALNPLREWLDGESFYLVNGDIVLDGLNNFSVLERALKDPQTIGACLVCEEGPRTVEFDPDCGYVTNWKSDEAGWPGTYTYCGFALLKPEILDYLEPTGESSIITAYEKAMMNGRFMKAIVDENLLWTDAGTVERYLEINQSENENAFAFLPQLAPIAERGDKIEFLGSRGSERAFFRSGDAIVVAYDDANRPENARYASHARWLAEHGVSVPTVIADAPKLKTLVLSWGGSEKKMSLEEYVKVVEALAKFNALDFTGLSLEPEFDAELYAWERDLFVEHCLDGRFHRALSPEVEAELKKVAERLIAEPKALVHRDFQSSNILWRGDKLTIIDFQGMRVGAAAYDLASLVYDPYATFTEGERRALVKLYAKCCGRAEIVEVLPLAAVQRLIQCLGAYGRLASVGQESFGRFVMPALVNLLAAADDAGLEAVGALAEDLIAQEEENIRRVHEYAHHHHHHHEDGCECGCEGDGE